MEEKIGGIPADQNAIYPDEDWVRGEVAASLGRTGYSTGQIGLFNGGVETFHAIGVASPFFVGRTQGPADVSLCEAMNCCL